MYRSQEIRGRARRIPSVDSESSTELVPARVKARKTRGDRLLFHPRLVASGVENAGVGQMKLNGSFFRVENGRGRSSKTKRIELEFISFYSVLDVRVHFQGELVARKW